MTRQWSAPAFAAALALVTAAGLFVRGGAWPDAAVPASPGLVGTPAPAVPTPAPGPPTRPADVVASPQSLASPASSESIAALPTLRLRATARLPIPPGAPSAHAAALAAWSPSAGAAPQLLAVWWAGSRESGPDVRVFLSRLGPQGWTAPRAIVDRESLGLALGAGVRRIGNPVLHAAPDGRLHLFVVATGLGGWAAGRVAHLVASGPDAPFVPQRLLPLTPLANTSVLVRAQPVPLVDGGWWLPAYFEIGRKVPMALRFAADGTLTGIERIGRSATSLQPTLIPLRDGRLLALMRDHGPERRIQVAEREAGPAGRWRDLASLPLGNVDTAVAAVSLGGAGLVMAHNDTSPPGSTPRSVLRLQHSVDGLAWQPGPVVQQGEPGAEFSYPNLLVLGTQLHVVYTHRREGIGHVVFDLEPAVGSR
jgi:predicted neuraminidase